MSKPQFPETHTQDLEEAMLIQQRKTMLIPERRHLEAVLRELSWYKFVNNTLHVWTGKCGHLWRRDQRPEGLEGECPTCAQNKEVAEKIRSVVAQLQQIGADV